MAEGFVHGDIVGRAATFDLARQDLNIFSDDVIVTDQPGLLRSEELRASVENALATIGNEAGTEDEVVVHFGGPGKA